MSYFDDASLVMIPSGYKTSKVYSVKPTDGTGDLTFSRSNDTATRVNSAGLIEKVRTNLNLYSQDFTNAAYVTGGYGSLASVVANTTANPLNGAQDADTATFTAGGTQSRLLQQFSGLSTTNKYTYSIYVKAGTKNTIRIYGDTSVIGVLAEFNLSTGSVVGTPTLCTASIVSAGSGWYRCSITFNAQGAGSADCGPVSAVGDDGTAFIYGAQLEVSDFGATDYIATTSAAVSVGPVANVPRLDYLNSSCPRLLLEPQRTNALTYSEDFSNAAYTKGQSSITVNAAIAPDGTMSADKLVEDTSNNTHVIYRSPSGTGATLSFFAKAAERNWVGVLSNNGNISFFNISNGTLGTIAAGSTATITPYGNGWYRCTLYNTHGSFGVSIYLATANGTDTYTGDGTSGAFIWGCQLETSAAYATSYIPTLGAAVTRGADAASKTSASALIGQTEGTIFVDFVWNGLQDPAATDSAIFSIGIQEYGTSNITIANYNGTMYARVTNGVTSEASFNFGALVVGTRYRAALAYANNDVTFYVNGLSYGSDTSASIPAISNLNFQNAYPNAKRVNQALLFKTRLSNADLAALTTI